MKKSLTRKLTIAVIALVFAVVSLSTSTYAWFTMSNTAQIDPFKADVKAGEGIEIAITKNGNAENAEWFAGNVPGSVVEEVIGNVKFDAVTLNSTTKEDFTQENFYSLSFDNGTHSNVNVTKDEENPKWVSFYIHVKTAQAGKVYLDNIALTSSQPAEWTVDNNFNLADGNGVTVNTKLYYEVANAVRVGFLTNETTTTIYENNDAAKQYDASQVNTVGITNNNGALSYWNNKYSLTGDKAATAPADKYNALQINTLANTAADLELGTTAVADGEIKVKVMIWVEGWDAECINAIFAQTLNTQFNIRYEETVGQGQ